MWLSASSAWMKYFMIRFSGHGRPLASCPAQQRPSDRDGGVAVAAEGTEEGEGLQMSAARPQKLLDVAPRGELHHDVEALLGRALRCLGGPPCGPEAGWTRSAAEAGAARSVGEAARLLEGAHR